MGLLETYRRLPPRVRSWVRYVAGAALAMGLVGILGFAVGAESARGASIPIREPGSPAPEVTTLSLFAHNAEIAVRSALGILSLGLYTTYVLLVNGFLIGATLADAAEVLGLGRAMVALAPHGVLELPAFWLAGAIGFRWLAFVWKLANGDRDRIAGPYLVLESLALTGLALVMLLVAAVIEATVSVHLV